MTKRLLIMLCVLIGLMGGTSAQDNGITITIGMNALQIEQLTGSLSNVIDDFEAANPDIRLNFVPLNFAPTGINDDDYFSDVAELVQQADVMAVRGLSLTQRVTLGGYILDLSPLATNNGDFLEPAWQSFQWDGGQWAIPTHYSLAALSYVPATFDEAGLPHPDADWTLDDLSLAANELTTVDESGEITRYGFEAFFESNILARAAFGTDFVDRTSIPYGPDLDNPQVTAFVDQWNTFIETTPIGPEIPESGAFVINPDPATPLRVSRSFLADVVMGRDEQRAFTTLPGGQTFVEAQGLAISAGTAAPEAAYIVAQFLATRPETTASFGGVMPAYTPLMAESAAFAGLERGGLVETYNTLLANAQPATALWFSSDFTTAAARARSGEGDITQTLAERETRITNWQNTAIAQNGSVDLTVAGPPSLDPVAQNEIVLNVGYQSPLNPLPNIDRWDDFLADFATNDPEVGRVDFQVVSGGLDTWTTYDCFATEFQIAMLAVDELLPLEPITRADPDFDDDDFLPGALAAHTLGGQLLGYPLTIEPLGIEYDVQAFLAAGVMLPGPTWTLTEFEAALQTLGVRPAFSAYNPSYILYLAAAYGGLPIDLTTRPYTANFTNPATIAALDAVLAWVRDERMVFAPQLGIGESFTQPPTAPMTASSANPLSGVTVFTPDEAGQVLYPGGTLQLLPFNTRAAYINQGSPSPEACYRLITAIAARPDLLLGAMPARSSLIADPNIAAITDAETVDLYTTVDALLRSGEAIPVYASQFNLNDLIGFYYETWLYEAIERHLADDVPLADALADAQALADGFAPCAADVPPRNEQPSYSDTINAYLTCATAVDPDIFGQGE